MIAVPGTPTVLRHKDVQRQMYANVHVDDILLVCKPKDVKWFQDNVGSGLSMKIDGPHLPASGIQVMYLKKRIIMRSDEILIRPNATYVPKLVSLLKVSPRRKKGLPYHATLEAYSPEFAVDADALNGEQAATFRSGLGLVLYMAMDTGHPICSENFVFIHVKADSQGFISTQASRKPLGWNSRQWSTSAIN